MKLSFYPKACSVFCCRKHALSDAFVGQVSSSTISSCIQPVYNKKQKITHRCCSVSCQITTIHGLCQLTVKQLYLASDPETTVQPHKPFCDRFYRLPLSLLHTAVCQTSDWLLSHTGKKCRHPATTQRCRSKSYMVRSLNTKY